MLLEFIFYCKCRSTEDENEFPKSFPTMPFILTQMQKTHSCFWNRQWAHLIGIDMNITKIRINTVQIKCVFTLRAATYIIRICSLTVSKKEQRFCEQMFESHVWFSHLNRCVLSFLLQHKQNLWRGRSLRSHTSPSGLSLHDPPTHTHTQKYRNVKTNVLCLLWAPC